MTGRTLGFAFLLMAAGCARHAGPAAQPSGPTPIAEARGATPAKLDSIWAAVDSAYKRHKWDDVVTLVQRFALEAPGSDPRVSQGRLYLGDAHVGKHEYLEAAREYRRVSDENPLDPLAPDALLRVGDAYAKLWRRPELDASYGQTALATYQELLSRYPNSDPAKQGQLRISELQDKFAVKQYKAAMYYLRFKAYDSAIIYIKDLVVSYPRAKIVPQALTQLIKAYRALNYAEDVQETCDYLRKYHPGDTGAQKVCVGVAPPAAPPS
jgi:outer membrane assembly lipoprotein YfiO